MLGARVRGARHLCRGPTVLTALSPASWLLHNGVLALRRDQLLAIGNTKFLNSVSSTKPMDS